MKQTKRYLTGLLAVLMLIGSIHIEGISVNASEKTDIDKIASEQVNDRKEEQETYSGNTISKTEESILSSEIDDEITINQKVEDTKQEEPDTEEIVMFNTTNNESASGESNDEIEPSETDNWELGLVFYDSTVNDGKTPLTEINWDASDGGYGYGESRVITVQINYRNTNAITTYQPDELAITIPNLVYNASSNIGNSPYWDVTIVVGANDSNHSRYNWNFKTGVSPTTLQKTFTFTNANIIEEKSNFEGSIQIVYTITPAKETPENYLDECIHSYLKTLQASLGYFIPAQDIKSPNWPNNYNNNMTEEINFWEVSLPGAEYLEINFDSTCKLEGASSDYLRFYDKDRNNITSSICEISDDKIGGSAMAGKIYYVAGDYVKITMRTDSALTYKGFSANIYGYRFGSIITESNDIELNYTRTYIHPWEYTDYTVIKSASKISSYDGLGENASNYIWVKYNFYHLLSFSTTDKYPNINANKGIYKVNS